MIDLALMLSLLLEQIRQLIKINKLKDEITDCLSLSEVEIKKAYRNEHEKVKAGYVLIEPEKNTDQIHPSFEELHNYYESHKA